MVVLPISSYFLTVHTVFKGTKILPFRNAPLSL